VDGAAASGDASDKEMRLGGMLADWLAGVGAAAVEPAAATGAIGVCIPGGARRRETAGEAATLLLLRVKQAEHEQQKWQNDAWNAVHHHSYSPRSHAQQSHAMHSAQLLLAH